MNQPHDPNVTADIPSAPADQRTADSTAAVDKRADPLEATEFLTGTGSSVDSDPAASPSTSASDSDSSGTPDIASTLDVLSIVAAPVAQAAGETWSLGGYRIVRKLGQGGMGTVYEAEDVKLKRRVALKVMKPEIAKNQDHRDRFLREARTAAKVESDYICPIYRVGEENGMPFIAMPFLKGEPLDAHLKQNQRLAIDDVLRIGKEVAQGLNAAHEAGLVHRDIKPANLWLETQRSGPPRAVILDFGLARKQADDVQITQSGAIIGTPAFMSPEQARGDKHVDARTDIFSLGCVLYVLCTGELPFKGETTMGVLTALATHDPTPPHILSETTPKALSDLIMRMLRKKPDDRPRTARAVFEQLVEIEIDPTKPHTLDLTAQVELPLSPATVASTSKPKSKGARKNSFARFTILIAGVLVGCGLTVAGVAACYVVFLRPSVLEEKPPAPTAEPSGEAPDGWVVVKSPVANYTIAMPQKPQINSAPSPTGVVNIIVAQMPNGTQLMSVAQAMTPNQLAQNGAADRVLNQFMLNMRAMATGSMNPGGQLPPVTKLSLGKYQGFESRVKDPLDGVYIHIRVYLIDNIMVMLRGPAVGDSPSPETAAFFNSLKVGSPKVGK